MKRFTFSLQPLYDMKQSEEKQQKLELFTLQKELQARYNEMTALMAEFEGTSAEYCSVVTSGVEAVRVQQYGQFFAKLKAAMTLTKEKISALETQKKKCVEVLVEIRKEIKLLEKLREEQYAEYLDKRKKVQEALIGDLVSFKATVS